MLRIGVDLSLTSPGLCVYKELERVCIAYYYPIRKREYGLKKDLTYKWRDIDHVMQLRPWRPLVVSEMSLMERYDRITEDIVQSIHVNLQHQPQVHIRMEGYAFNAASSSLSKLHELGGILKHKFYQQNWTYEEIPPTKLKKQFSGTGSATKTDMYSCFVKKGFPPLLHTFHLEKGKDIANPVQDIVDACALVDSGLD